MGKLNRLRSKPAFAGWISIAVLIWKVLGEIDTLNSVVQNMSTAWNFLSTPVGMLVLLVIGLALIAFAVFRPERKIDKPIVSKSEVLREPTRLDDDKRILADWLTANMQYEKSNPRHFFRVRMDGFGLYLDSVSGPYLRFRFAVQTSTIHTFKFLPEKTSGHIKYMKQDLARVPEVEDQSQDILTRETQTVLGVKQFLEPITATHIRKLHDNQEVPEASFEFGGLNIYMQATQPDGSIDKELWKLPLPGVWKVRIADEEIRS